VSLIVIGEGSFGTVHCGFCPERNMLIAVKVVQKSHLLKRQQCVDSNDCIRRAQEEILALKHVQPNPHIMDLFSAYQTDSCLYIKTAYYCGGEFLTYLDNNSPLSFDVAMFYVVELAAALSYLHDKCVFYGDLKPENIALDSRGHMKILDFGLAMILPSKTSRFQTSSGSLEYVAPEILMRYNQGIGIEADWWSFGILSYELFFGDVPFMEENRQSLCNLICEGQLDSDYMREMQPAVVVDLLQNVLEKSPHCRLGNPLGPDILQHSLFANTPWDLVNSHSLEPPYVPYVSSPRDFSHFAQEFISTPNTIVNNPVDMAVEGYDWK